MITYLHRANSFSMIEKAKAMNIGIEVDIRTHNGIVFFSHDCITAGNNSHPYIDDAISYIEAHEIPTILDFKETGIIDKVAHYISKPELFYCTDLIFPDQLWAKKHFSLKTLSRLSKYEWIQETDGYWFDYMFTSEDLEDYKDEMCHSAVLVSPELHGKIADRQYIDTVKAKGFKGICTDDPIIWL